MLLSYRLSVLLPLLRACDSLFHFFLLLLDRDL